MDEHAPNADQPGAGPARPDAAEAPGEPVMPDAAEAALESVQQASEAVETIAQEASGQTVQLEDFAVSAAGQAESPTEMKLLDDVTLRVTIELGRTRMYVEDVLRLSADSVIELDKAAGDPVDIYVNDRHVARGEVLVLNENFCVRISEIIDSGASDD